MHALLVSFAVVAMAEIGDKTQLLSLVLAAKFRRPWPIIAGIFIATLLNHFLAGLAGAIVAQWLNPEWLRWFVVASFVGVAIWTLLPDTLGDNSQLSSQYGAFIATVIAFFLAEMGDKTQVATIILATEYQPLWQIVVGTTGGMLLANVPVVALGSRFANKLPLKFTRIAAAVLFFLLAAWIAFAKV